MPEAALTLFEAFLRDARYLTLMRQELDILIWAPVGTTASEISRRSQQCFRDAEKHHLRLALLEVPAELACDYVATDATGVAMRRLLKKTL